MATGFSVSVTIGGSVSPSLNAAVNAAKAQVNGLAASVAAAGNSFNAPFAAVNKHIDAAAKRMANLQRAGRNATLGVTAPAAWFGANLVKGAVDFDRALNLSEALGDLPNTERDSLEKIAQNLAKRYDAGGATGIVKTTTELMKAGLTFEQAKGSLEQVLATSAVSGDMTAADVGTSLSKSLAQFQMPVANLAQVTKSAQLVTDRMTYAAVNTVASMKDISESFKYAGGVMSATGNTLDQTTGIVMSFAKAGVLGSEAGVALRSALVRLVKMPKGGLAALERIGMNLSDYTSARPVTAKGVVGGLQAGGIDASTIEGQIAGIIKANGKRGPTALGAAITKAVQDHLGSSSAVDASTIADSVNASIAAAGSKIDITKFFTDLRAKLDSGAATMGDVAQILEARHISRYMALLKDDLPALIAQVTKEADGYAMQRYAVVMKGLPADVQRLSAAFDQLQKSIVKVVTPELSAMFDRIAGWIDRIGAYYPVLLKLGVGLTAAAAAAGPLAFVLGAVGRVGLLGMKGLNLAVMGLLMPFRLLGTLAATALTAAAARLGAMALGLRMLTALGAGATLSALGGSLLSLGKSVLLFPVTALRGIGIAMYALVANPVGLIITAVVAALTALGVWVYNNWDGLKQFFATFGEGFMNGLGPASDGVKKLADSLGSVVNWLGQLLGPLDSTGAKWKEWGTAVGGAAAEGVNALISGIQRLIGFFDAVIQKASSLGSAIKNIFTSAPKSAGLFSARIPAAPKVEGARALGGPVSYGKPYLVGERGPELFVPRASGRVETNNTLRRLTADGASAVAATAHRPTQDGAISVTNHWTINGATDPRGVADQVDSRFSQLMRRLKADQSGYLSD
ncbi:phage tail tape measure protein [Bradyrhizobium sp. SZCCHNPS2010]|uniref:phage tail tape measure protein n=1 Tax=Bradyrhizobium sp. SZCCHNPS2010 TaxID=3057333 RepID=UPI002915C849|nr:phage tail tape measure protein [Bradyrhizobium sp. SZCCHNPS2010]